MTRLGAHVNPVPGLRHNRRRGPAAAAANAAGAPSPAAPSRPLARR